MFTNQPSFKHRDDELFDLRGIVGSGISCQVFLMIFVVSWLSAFAVWSSLLSTTTPDPLSTGSITRSFLRSRQIKASRSKGDKLFLHRTLQNFS